MGSSLEIREIISGMAYASAIDRADDFNDVKEADFCQAWERNGAMGRMDTGTLSLPMKAVFIDDDGVFDAFFDAMVERASTCGLDI